MKPMNLTAKGARRPRRNAGFTLVELMVVIAIIAALATIVGVNVLGSLDDADVANAKAQIRTFKTALVAYRVKFNQFPTTGEGLGALINNSKGVNFLESKEIPLDPWGNEYQYTSDNSRSYTIISYGADGVPGGTGANADISSDSLGGEK